MVAWLTPWLPSLSNLQTLIIGCLVHIYYARRCSDSRTRILVDLPHLRHAEVKWCYPSITFKMGNVLLLQTLSEVRINKSFPSMLAATLNLRKLGIDLSLSTEVPSAIDPTYLNKLEVLSRSCIKLPHHLIIIFFKGSNFIKRKSSNTSFQK